MKVNLGYCCVSMLYKKLQCSRCSTKTYLEKHSQAECHQYLMDKAKKNLEDLIVLLNKNKENDILAYRVPEQLLPQIDLGYYTIEEMQKELQEVGNVANALGIQLSTHPSQYYVLNSLRDSVVNKTIQSLNLFADTFSAMELDKVPNMTLHLGMKNGYETEEEALDAFCRNYERLNAAARKYLVLENDHVSFQVEQCIKVNEKIGIPIVFDNKHYEWNPGEMSYEECVSRVVKTWGTRVPKFHLSSDKPGNKHAHSDYVELEDYEKMVHSIEKTGITECVIMLECKKKDLAVMELRKLL